MNRQNAVFAIAEFVVERLPGKGYIVTKSEGPQAVNLKNRAIELLDLIGQKDPTGPETVTHYYRDPRSGEFVRVVVRQTPSGESKYEQAWFCLPTANRSLFAQSLRLLLAIGIGAFLGWGVLSVFQSNDPVEVTHQGANDLPHTSKGMEDNPESNSNELAISELSDQVANSRKTRTRLLAFLIQDGLAAPREGTITPEATLKIEAGLGFNKVPVEEVRFTNLEVSELIDLLSALHKAFPSAVTDGSSSTP